MTSVLILLTVFAGIVHPICSYLQYHLPWNFRRSHTQTLLQAEPHLTPTRPNTVGNFFDTTQNNSFLQCLLLGTTSINEVQYGIGIPMHTPVMLLQLNDRKEVVEVSEDEPFYDHLIDSISNQLESYDLMLHRTPLYLTVEGDFEEDEEEIAYDEIDDDGDEEEEEEVSLEDMVNEYSTILNERIDDVDDDVEEDIDSEPEGLEEEGFVTRETSKTLYQESRFVDKVMNYAKDVKYIGSFHHKKRNYHLIRLLDTQLIFGRREISRKGYQFNLLNPKESDTIRPKLERLIEQYLSSSAVSGETNPPKSSTFSDATKRQQAEFSSKRSWITRNDRRAQ